jgi:hypothetical protein
MVPAGSASACVCSPETHTLQNGATRGTDAGAKLWHRAFGAADWTPVSCEKRSQVPTVHAEKGGNGYIAVTSATPGKRCIHVAVYTCPFWQGLCHRPGDHYPGGRVKEEATVFIRPALFSAFHS